MTDKKRKPWAPILIKVAVFTVVCSLFFSWVESRFLIGIDSQVIRCLPDHQFYLVDTAKKGTDRGTIVAYRAKGLTAFFEDGTMMAKIIKGLPGDHLLVNKQGVFINDVKVAEGFPLVDRLDIAEDSLYRDEVIPTNKYLLLAPSPESYDGRYWGYIDKDQVVGKAIPFY